MPYPASTKTLETWTQEIDRQFSLVKSSAEQQKALSQAGTLNLDFIRRFFDLLVQTNNFCISVASVPGIAEYAAAQKQGHVADPVAAFTATRNAVIGTLNWLRSNLPSGTFGGNTYALAFMLPTDNTTQISSLTFSAGQTAGYRTVLDTLIGTIS